MKPALKAGLLPLWRDRDTIQFGVDPRRAVALGGLEGLGQAAAVISLLDGSRDRESLIATAQAYGVPPEAVNRVLTALAAAGVLDDFPVQLHASLPGPLRARLAPELATASLAYGDGDGGARTLARRRAAFVRVHGAGRTGACVASFLAGSGVGVRGVWVGSGPGVRGPGVPDWLGLGLTTTPRIEPIGPTGGLKWSYSDHLSPSVVRAAPTIGLNVRPGDHNSQLSTPTTRLQGVVAIRAIPSP